MIYREDVIAEYYTDPEHASFTVGKCISEDSDSVILATYDDQGKWNGYYWYKKCFLCDVRYDTEYITKLNRYIEYWKDKNPLKPLVPVERIIGSSIDELLGVALEEKFVVTVFDGVEYNVGLLDTDADDYEMSCIDVSNGKIFDNISFKSNELIFFELDSPDNWLLKYALIK